MSGILCWTLISHFPEGQNLGKLLILTDYISKIVLWSAWEIESKKIVMVALTIVVKLQDLHWNITSKNSSVKAMKLLVSWGLCTHKYVKEKMMLYAKYLLRVVKIWDRLFTFYAPKVLLHGEVYLEKKNLRVF